MLGCDVSLRFHVTVIKETRLDPAVSAGVGWGWGTHGVEAGPVRCPPPPQQLPTGGGQPWGTRNTRGEGAAPPASRQQRTPQLGCTVWAGGDLNSTSSSPRKSLYSFGGLLPLQPHCSGPTAAFRGPREPWVVFFGVFLTFFCLLLGLGGLHAPPRRGGSRDAALCVRPGGSQPRLPLKSIISPSKKLPPQPPTPAETQLVTQKSNFSPKTGSGH